MDEHYFDETDFDDLKARAESKNGKGSADISARQLSMLVYEIIRLRTIETNETCQ